MTFFRSRRYRRKLFGLLVLASIPVAIWWALANPIQSFPTLVHAAAIVLLFSSVLFVVHRWLSRRQDKIRTAQNRDAMMAYEAGASLQGDDIVGIVAPESELQESHPRQQESAVQDQLRRVDDNVRNYDLGVENIVPPTSKYELASQALGIEPSEGTVNTDQLAEETNSIVASRDLMVNDVDTRTLLKMSTPEIKQLVGNLQQDKTRLQKLVLAQQAAIDTERKAHDISRVAAQDAIKIMRDARGAQKNAEKLARRERAERQRLERQYHKVKQALTNAKSIINAREEAVSRGEIAG